jgi:hypothetical protein
VAGVHPAVVAVSAPVTGVSRVAASVCPARSAVLTARLGPFYGLVADAGLRFEERLLDARGLSVVRGARRALPTRVAVAPVVGVIVYSLAVARTVVIVHDVILVESVRRRA